MAYVALASIMIILITLATGWGWLITYWIGVITGITIFAILRRGGFGINER